MRRFFGPIIVCAMAMWANCSWADSGTAKVDGVFSLAIPTGWECVSSDFDATIPAQLSEIFDGADAKETNLKLVGWKRDGAKNIVAAFAVTHIRSGAGQFNKLLKATTPEERTRIATRFSDTVAQKVLIDYTRERNMEITDNSVEVLEAGDMTVVLADALIKDGNAIRTRSGTIFFRGDSVVAVSCIYDNKFASSYGKKLEELVTSIAWSGQ